MGTTQVLTSFDHVARCDGTRPLQRVTNHSGARKLACKDELGLGAKVRGAVEHHFYIHRALVDHGVVIHEVINGLDIASELRIVYDALNANVFEACDEGDLVGEQATEIVKIGESIVPPVLVRGVPVRPYHRDRSAWWEEMGVIVQLDEEVFSAVVALFLVASLVAGKIAPLRERPQGGGGEVGQGGVGEG